MRDRSHARTPGANAARTNVESILSEAVRDTGRRRRYQTVRRDRGPAKAMVEIGGRPILWHIMHTYAHFGLTDFIICAGYNRATGEPWRVCHYRAGQVATVTAIRPPARFAAIDAEGDRVVRFEEKPQAAEGWIKGGFFVLGNAALDYVDNDSMSLELDHRRLEEMWASGRAPWELW